MASLHFQHKKRRKISLTPTPWDSETLYTYKLLRALRRDNPIAGNQVRAAADRVLAATAKAPTRWTRAILAKPNPLPRFNHKKVKKWSRNRNALMKNRAEIPRTLAPIQKKTRLLRRLIPGCRKLSFPKLLQEAHHYISALQMQVGAMTALSHLLSAAPIGFPSPTFL
ncbi:hypothetical protein VNO78_18278 [Psophocarpus tetragonolobus]|uniref:Uncharacterized protein n=1 Tax=Psophocarpus tetragonolobus TaxID=3891 RepID=A0AAN9SIH7_PSOTE